MEIPCCMPTDSTYMHTDIYSPATFWIRFIALGGGLQNKIFQHFLKPFKDMHLNWKLAKKWLWVSPKTLARTQIPESWPEFYGRNLSTKSRKQLYFEITSIFWINLFWMTSKNSYESIWYDSIYILLILFFGFVRFFSRSVRVKVK